MSGTPVNEWGLTDGELLGLWGVLIVVPVVMAFLTRRWLFRREARTGDRTADLDPYELSLLRYGPDRAVTVAVVQLRLRGALVVREVSSDAVMGGHPRTLVAVGVLPPDAHPLERAVHAALTGDGLPSYALRLRMEGHPALDEVAAPLYTRGLLRHRTWCVRVARRSSYWFAIPLTVCVFWLLTGGNPTGEFSEAVMIMTLVPLFLFRVWVPALTSPAGEEVLERAERTWPSPYEPTPLASAPLAGADLLATVALWSATSLVEDTELSAALWVHSRGA